jgi:hypothetical protein
VVVVVVVAVVEVVVVVVVEEGKEICRIAGVNVDEAAGRAARGAFRSVAVDVVVDDPWVDSADALAAA